MVRKRSKSSSRAIEFSWNNCIEERVARVPRLLDVRDARRTPQKLNNGIPLYSRYSQTEVEIIREAELRPCTTGLDLSPSSVVPTIPPPIYSLNPPPVPGPLQQRADMKGAVVLSQTLHTPLPLPPPLPSHYVSRT